MTLPGVELAAATQALRAVLLTRGCQQPSMGQRLVRRFLSRWLDGQLSRKVAA